MIETGKGTRQPQISCFADEIAESLDRQIEVLQDLNIRWIELRSADGIGVADFTPEYACQVKEKLDRAGIRVSAIGSPIGKIGIEDDFVSHMKTFDKITHLANVFETPYIRVFSFYLPKGRTPENCREQVMRRIEQMVKEAARCRLVLLHENEKEIYGDNAARCLDLMNHFAGENFRCTFDFANFVECDQDTMEAYRLLKPYIEYVHIKDALHDTKEIVPAGRGDGQLSAILSLLADSGYSGFFSLEPHLANFSGLNKLEQNAALRAENDTEKAFRLAYHSFVELLKTTF